MKNKYRVLTICLSLGLFISPSWADLEPADQFLSVFGGGTGGFGSFQDKVEPGTKIGVSYRFQLTDRFSVGPEFGWSKFYEQNYSNNAKLEVSVISLAAFLRFDFMPYSSSHPFLKAGPSHNIFSYEFAHGDHQNKSDGNQTGVFGGAGYSHEFSDALQWSFEARYHHLGADSDVYELLLGMDFRTY